MTRGLILDLDNTLYSWVDAFAPAFRAQVHVLSEELRISEESLTDNFREVYKRHGTVEYPNAINEIAAWSSASVDATTRDAVTERATKVFSIVWRKSLSLYPGVAEVLKWAFAQDVVIVGLSDALQYWALLRLKQLGVTGYFRGLYSWHQEWFMERRSTSRLTTVSLSADQLKPNAMVINQIIKDYDLDRRTTMMVGDSLTKDVAAARAAGVVDVWARYGTAPKEANLQTLRQITPWTPAARSAEETARTSVQPTFTIEAFSELRSLIGETQASLFRSQQ